MWGLFPGTPSPHPQSDKRIRLTAFVTTHGLRNINLISIGYAFRPRLRGRLTLRGLALRRKPWTFGGSVSHTPYRYSCQHSRFRYLQRPSRAAFTGLRNAPLPCQKTDVSCQFSEGLGFSPSHSTSWQLPDTHRATASTSLRRCIPGRNNSAAKRASHRSTPEPST